MNIIRYGFTILATMVACQLLFSQSQNIDAEYKKQAIASLSNMIVDYYVFPDVGQQTADHLAKSLQEGKFDDVTDKDTFAKMLTDAVQSVNKDKHMSIRVNPPFEAEEESVDRMIEEKLHQLKRTRTYNSGFNTVKVLEGNVGYLDLRGFAYFDANKEVADAYMKLITNTDAIIIDMSKNGGGDPAMVQYLCSYFFEDDVHLNSLYYREGNRTIDYFTKAVDGTKLIDVPLFVITGSRTFSGAEEFSYNMQTQKRATLIGETTGGGANPGGTRPINKDLSVFIPIGRAINPITKTNWEGVGVVPEIKLSQDEAYDKAYAMAKEAADTYRQEKEKENTKSLQQLFYHIESYQKDQDENQIFTTIKENVDKGLIQEWEVNMLGYEYMENSIYTALIMFKANTVLFPESPNVHDSYGEALLADNQNALAIRSYQKAVELATQYNVPDIEMYKENLAKAMQR